MPKFKFVVYTIPNGEQPRQDTYEIEAKTCQEAVQQLEKQLGSPQDLLKILE